MDKPLTVKVSTFTIVSYIPSILYFFFLISYFNIEMGSLLLYNVTMYVTYQDLLYLCAEARGICHRYNYVIEKTRLKRRIDGDDDDVTDIDDGLMLFTCDDVGGYEKQQCHGNDCWSVNTSIVFTKLCVFHIISYCTYMF